MSYVILFFSVINLLLGVLIFFRVGRDRKNLFFLLFAVATSLWMFNNFYLRVEPTTTLLRLSYGIGALVASIGLVWVNYFLKKNISNFVTYIAFPISLLLFWISSSSDLIIVSLKSIETFGYEAETGQLFQLYSLYIGAVVLALLIMLIKNLVAETDKLRKQQIFYVLIGTFIFSIVSIIVSFLVPVLLNTLSFTTFDNIGFSIFLGMIGYAIIRHQLFDIKVIATELLVFSLWIFLLIRIFLSDVLRDQIIDGGLLALVIFFGILLIRSVLKEVRLREEIAKLAEDLRVANAELNKLDQMKSEFVSLASHQLRTPLTVIKGYISMIQEGSFGKVADPLSDALRKIYISNETLINLVGDFLNLSRIESGKMKYTFEPTQMEGIIQSVFEEFMEVVKEKKLELRYENPETPLAKAMLDKDKFKQVIMNLVDNAVKYTPEGSVTLKIEEEKEKGNVLFSVSDTGVGMSKGELDGIFKRFSRGESGSKVNTSGLGLGLYLAKRIVTDHGGEIWATSDGPGKGSTFWVRVPVHI